MANDKAKLSIVGVSRSQEASYNEYQTVDVALETDKEATVPNPTFVVENNVGRAAAKEFPDRVTNVSISGMNVPFSFIYPQAHEFAFLLANALGEGIAPIAVPGSQGVKRSIYFSKTGVERLAAAFGYHADVIDDVDTTKAYKTSGNPELPSFTAGFQLSASDPVAKVLAAGGKMNTFTLEANRVERFPVISGEATFSGKTKTNIYDEIIEALHTAGGFNFSRTVEGATAATRLLAVHRILADIDGDGVYEKDVEPLTVAAAPAPVAVTFTPPLGEPVKILLSDNGQLTDYTEAAQTAGAPGVPANLVMAEDYIYVGFRVPISSVVVTVGTVNGAGTAALTAQYWNGSAWASVTNLVNGTFTTRTFGQSGTISFTKPADWAKLYFGDTGAKAPLFWFRLAAAATITDLATINQISASTDLDFDSVVRFTSPSTFADITANANDRNANTVSVAMAAADMFYFGSKRPFSGIRADVAVAQTAAEGFTFEYWNGSAWTALVAVDNTSTVVDTPPTLVVDGDFTWTAPTAWRATTLADAGVAASGNTKELYWVRAIPTDPLTVGTVNSLRLVGKKIQYLVIYRQNEATYLPELATMPDVVATESALIIQQANLYFGGTFNGVELEGGFTLGCSLNSFTLNYNNNHGDPEPCWGGEGDGAYADQILRGDPDATLVVNRRLVDWLMQQGIRSGSPFKIHLEFEGKQITGTNPPAYFRVRIHLDRVWYEENAIGTDNGRFTETATLRIGESDEHPAIVAVIESKDGTGFAAAA